MKTKIIIDKSGKIITFKEDITKKIIERLETKETKEKRESYIIPENPILKQIFKLIRKTFKDNHPISNWTRNWKCKWQIEIIETKQKIKGFTDRKKAIEKEKEIISKIKIASIIAIVITQVNIAFAEPKREIDKKLCKIIYDNITTCLLEDDSYKRHMACYKSANKDLKVASYCGRICSLIYEIGLADRSKEPVKFSGLSKEIDPIIKDYLVDYCKYNQQDIEDKIKREWNEMVLEREKEKQQQ